MPSLPIKSLAWIVGRMVALALLCPGGQAFADGGDPGTMESSQGLAQGYINPRRPFSGRQRREPATEKSPLGLHLNKLELGHKVVQKSRFSANVTAKSRESYTFSYDVMARAEGAYVMDMSLPGGRPTIELKGYLREKWAKTSGSESSYAFDNGSYYPVTAVAPPGSFRFLTALTEAELALPVAEDLTLVASQSAGYGLPDVGITRLTAIYATAAGLKFDNKVYESKLNARYRTVYVAQQPPAGPVGFYNYFGYLGDKFDGASSNTFSGNLLNADGKVVRRFDTISFGVRAGYSTSTPADGYFMYGEASSVSFGLSADAKFPFGTKVGTSVGRSMLNDYRQSVNGPTEGKKVDVVAQGTTDEFGLNLEISPVDWFTVAALYQIGVSSYTGVGAEQISEFNQVATKQGTSYGLMIGMQKQF